MKPVKLTCPYARYNFTMHIDCMKTAGPCANQRWCAGKGWCVLTEQAAQCPAARPAAKPAGEPAKEAKDNERKAKAAPKRRNKV